MHTFPGAELVFSGVFGQGSGLSIQPDAPCMGNEASFLQCPWIYYDIGYDHTNDKGVRCAPGMYSFSRICENMIAKHSFIMLKCLFW